MEAFLVNDSIKYRAFGTLKDSLLVLLTEGDLMEKYLALTLLVNFSFDDTLCEKIRKNDTDAIELIEKMLKQLNLDESIRIKSFCLKNLLGNKNLINDHKHKPKRKTFSLKRTRLVKSVLINYHGNL